MPQPQVTINKNIKFTYSDYILYPNNGKQIQLMEGEFYMSPAPRPYHQIILRNIFRIVDNFVTSRNLGIVLFAPTDVVFSKEDVVQPDLLCITKERQHIIARNYIKGAPDLTIEILSDKTKKLDVKLKRALYAKYGVKEYWIVDPDKKKVETMRLGAGGYKEGRTYQNDEILHAYIFPGLSISLTDIFKK